MGRLSCIAHSRRTAPRRLSVRRNDAEPPIATASTRRKSCAAGHNRIPTEPLPTCVHTCVCVCPLSLSLFQSLTFYIEREEGEEREKREKREKRERSPRSRRGAAEEPRWVHSLLSIGLYWRSEIGGSAISCTKLPRVVGARRGVFRFLRFLRNNNILTHRVLTSSYFVRSCP